LDIPLSVSCTLYLSPKKAPAARADYDGHYAETRTSSNSAIFLLTVLIAKTIEITT